MPMSESVEPAQSHFKTRDRRVLNDTLLPSPDAGKAQQQDGADDRQGNR